MNKTFRRGGNNGGSVHSIYGDYQEIVHYWILQTLISLGAHKSIILERHCTDDEILQELGLSYLTEAQEFNANEARQALQKLQAQLETLPRVKLPTHTQLAKNIQWLGKIIGLNDIE